MVDTIKIDLDTKFLELKELLKNYQPGIICVSGGMDSSLLYYLTKIWKMDYLPLFFTGPHITNTEIKHTIDFLSSFSKKFLIEEIDPLVFDEIKNNSKLRCYYCKKMIFKKARTIGERLNRLYILDGTNFSDTFSFRPGIWALKELNIISPLKEAKITKEDIINLFKKTDLSSLKIFSRPCLLTRFSYNYPIDKKKLTLVAYAEDKLLNMGFNNFRLRVIDGKYELHIHNLEKDRFYKNEEKIKNLFDSLNIDFKVKFLKKISGYFDKL